MISENNFTLAKLIMLHKDANVTYDKELELYKFNIKGLADYSYSLKIHVPHGKKKVKKAKKFTYDAGIFTINSTEHIYASDIDLKHGVINLHKGNAAGYYDTPDHRNVFYYETNKSIGWVADIKNPFATKIAQKVTEPQFFELANLAKKRYENAFHLKDNFAQIKTMIGR